MLFKPVIVDDMSDVVDRLAIHELINLHGHLMDEGDFEYLDQLFIDDVVYDLSAFGGGQLHGITAVVEAGRGLADRNPLAHLVTNIVVTELGPDVARARSKGLAVMKNGSTGSVVYDDELRRTATGWRIAVRRVLPRHSPLHPSGPAPSH